MADEDDDLTFADEDEGGAVGAAASPGGRAWKVLIVDDDREVHTISRMVLERVRYRDGPLELLSAYSAAEARGVIAAHSDLAVILLDVVMETDDAGLKLAHTIRRDIGNKSVRIILRTGQPGQAPERNVIVDYDINDYKAKTELTAQKLFTTTYAALRGYDDIITIEQGRRGLETILEAAASLFQVRNLDHFAAGALARMSLLLDMPSQGLLVVPPSTDGGPSAPLRVLSATGRYADLAGLALDTDAGTGAQIAAAFALRRGRCDGHSLTLYVETPGLHRLVIHQDLSRPLGELERGLVDVFSAKLGVGFDNLRLFHQLKSAHEATIVALADLAEFKDTDTGEHVLRVSRTTVEVARSLRQAGQHAETLTERFIELIGTGSILHDVGKVSTPDNILRKPGALTPEEREVMVQHAGVGAAILEKASRMVDGGGYLAVAAEIAAGHHEWFDGTGYPHGRRGQAIPLSARIVAVADVFDALTHRRPYKEPWPLDKALAYIRERSGSQFDPVIVAALDEVLKVRGLLDAAGAVIAGS